MSVLNDGNNLPGSLIDFEREISQDYDPSQFGKTESVLIIGTAFKGPANQPVDLYNGDMARYFFGGSYDPETHRSASLTANVQACFDRGCTTVRAMRVGGKDIYKDFRFCEEADTYRLRISSQTPTNTTKQCYLLVNVNSGREEIDLFKPASCATLAERKQGLVDSEDSLIVAKILLNEDEGITRNDKLVDLISIFNRHARNNMLIMSIVNENGEDVTDLPEAQDLRVGSLFNGIYFVGRDRNTDDLPAITVVNAKAITAAGAKPYNDYVGNYYRVLEFNSDVSSEYPIGAAAYKELQDELAMAGITAGVRYEFLNTAGIVDRVWAQDSVDYEEVDLSRFELYKRLGSGYAITAKAVSRGTKNGVERRPRVIETPQDDVNHIVPIKTGVYSLLENFDSDYRVLVAANADEKISAKLPKADDFLTSTGRSFELLGDGAGNGALITATAKVDKDDLTAPKSYVFRFKKVAEQDIETDVFSDVYADKVAKMAAAVQVADPDNAQDDILNLFTVGELPNGAMFVAYSAPASGAVTDARLYTINNGNVLLMNVARFNGALFVAGGMVFEGVISGTDLKLNQLVSDSTKSADGKVLYNGFEYFLVDNGHTTYVAGVKADDVSEPVGITPLGKLSNMTSGNDTKTLIFVEDNYGAENNVTITTGAADFIPLEEFLDILKQDPVLGKLFEFELTQEGANLKEEYPEDIEAEFATVAGAIDPSKLYFGQEYPLGSGTIIPAVEYRLKEDRTIGYDYTKYIPYRTNDNFVRQLAQHCAYTTLRTHVTHGIIGYTPLRALTLDSIAKRASELSVTDFSLVAKKDNGRPMRDSQNNPYEIGRNVTVTAFQYRITDSVDSYTSILNGAAGYAGMISCLPVEKSTTMQPTGLSNVDFFFSNNQLLSIIGAGFVAVKNSDARGIAVVDGITMAPSSDLGRRLSITRTMNVCGNAIREASEPFISLKNSIANRNALKTAIDSALHELTDVLIWDYRFEIANIETYSVDSVININYEIFPMNEIRSINNSIRVTRQSTQA